LNSSSQRFSSRSAAAGSAPPKTFSRPFPSSPFASPTKSKPMFPNAKSCRTCSTSTSVSAHGEPSARRTVRVTCERRKLSSAAAGVMAEIVIDND
jgi:hypothetical protein